MTDAADVRGRWVAHACTRAHTAQREARVHETAGRGAAPSYTPEEFAEMQAFVHEEEADNRRKLAQLWQLPNKRSRNT